MAWQGGAGGCGVLEIGLTKNGLQLGHCLLRDLGEPSLSHDDGCPINKNVGVPINEGESAFFDFHFSYTSVAAQWLT